MACIKARGLPSFVSLSCSTRKTRADHPWSARSPDKSSTRPFVNLRLTLRFTLRRFTILFRSKVHGAPSVVRSLDGATIHRIVATTPSRPASLGRPGQTIPGLPVRRAKGPLDPLQCSGSPIAWAFGGAKVHWTLAFYRLTPRTFILARFTPVPLLR